ncbi:TetR/AcrR family transcriptional regulator [Saccharomonospora sp. NB11]|jgi:AcrR family transcriptional regulator|uniref:TetR/AcrR family transcriptional regulator n=1 Tax=Saccharomonospora sp. NB11 TaxID=1642298 RepID=UPI0018D08189|nr:TetR/AcrR family transcriptional regulator [Saccharomonospora sp. NB11]
MVREPRQERSRTTRLRLMEAAVDCLAEFGWTGTTVGVVAERAGVSRGAAQHHFPTREDLVVATVEYLAEQQIAELRRRADTLPPGRRRAEPVARLLLNTYTGPKFRAALHLWVAASTDDALRAVLAPLEAKVGREAHRVAVDLLDADESRPGVRETVQATLDLARGLGLADLLSDDSKRRERLVRQWARMVEPIIGE